MGCMNTSAEFGEGVLLRSVLALRKNLNRASLPWVGPATEKQDNKLNDFVLTFIGMVSPTALL